MKTKKCSRCKKEKDVTEYYPDSRVKSGLRGSCKDCCSKDSKERNDKKIRKWKQVKKDSVPSDKLYCPGCESIKTKDEFYTNRASKSGYATYCILCSAKSTKKSTIKHREKRRAAEKNWRHKNPEKVREYWQRRYARMKNIEGEILASDIAEKYSEQNGRCPFCGKNFGIHYHVDHIIPVSKGGTHTPDNIQLLCSTCNLSKNNKNNEEYMEYLDATR